MLNMWLPIQLKFHSKNLTLFYAGDHLQIQSQRSIIYRKILISKLNEKNSIVKLVWAIMVVKDMQGIVDGNSNVCKTINN